METYFSDWTEKLIRSIELRPALYDKSLPEYCDRYINKEKWDEVCQEMISNWDQLSPDEKTLKGKEIHQRWRNLRTCFKRELNKQHQSEKLGQSSRRRKYIYFDSLSFLLPIMEDQETVSNNGSATITKEEIEEYEEINDEPYVPVRVHPKNPATKRPRKDAVTYEDPFLDTLKLNEFEEIDEDKLFLLSLVPSLKRLDEDQKLDAKMQFIQVIKRIRNAQYVEND